MQLKKAIDQFLEGYFSTCQRSEKTIQAYTVDLDQFRQFVGGRPRLQKIRPEVLEKWAAKLKEAGYASASIRRKFATLKVFFNYWVRKEVLDRSPAWKVRLDLAPERVLTRVLTLEETKRLLRQAKVEMGRFPRRSSVINSSFLALRNLAIVELLFATGIRIGELTALCMEDFYIEERSLIIRGKGARERLAFLPDRDSFKAVHSYYQHRQGIVVNHKHIFIFINSTGEPLSSQGAASITSRIADSAGIHQRVTPHMLRHTVITFQSQWQRFRRLVPG